MRFARRCIAIAALQSLLAPPVVCSEEARAGAPTRNQPADSPTTVQYNQRVAKAIYKHWYPPMGYEYRRCELLVELDSSGKVVSEKIVKTTHAAISDEAAKFAIKEAAPFGAPPTNGNDGHTFLKVVYDMRTVKGVVKVEPSHR